MAATMESVDLKSAMESPEQPVIARDGSLVVDNNKKAEKNSTACCGPLRIFRFCSCGDILLLIIGILANIGAGVMLPVFMLVFGDLINSIGGPPAADAKDFTYYVKLQAILGVISFVTGWTGATCVEWAAERQLWRIRREYLVAIMRQEMGWFDTFDAGTLSARLNENCVQIRDAIGIKFGQIFLFASMFVGGLSIGLVRGWKLGLVIVAAMPLMAGAGWFMMKSLTTAGEKSRRAYGDAGSVAEESLSNIRTVAAFGAEKRSTARYIVCLDKAMSMRGVLGQGLGMGTVMGVMFLTYALGFWFGGKLIADDLDSGCDAAAGECFQGGDALTVFFCVVIAAFVVGQAGPNVTAFMKGSAAALDLFDLIDRKSQIDPFSKDGVRDVPLKGEVVFKGVKFAYPARPDKAVFESLDLHIPAGQTVALVGASGCGKSTTIQLIERFYDISGGSVEIDGRDVREYNLDWLRSQMAIVSQEPRLFAESIAENIRFGKLDATHEEIEASAKSANAHHFISDFPKAFDTLVGESGGQLSGGQKQRIAIARAVIRDPKILILDEATSALDNESEKIVQQTLDDLIKQTKRTTIVIAHRLTTVRNADKIVVLDNTSGLGAVVLEEGSHDELMKIDNGLYLNLVNSQSLSVADQARRQTVRLLTEEFVTPSRALSTSSRTPSHMQEVLRSLSTKYVEIDAQYSPKMDTPEEVDVQTKCGCIKVKKSKKKQKPAPSFFKVTKKLKDDWWKIVLGVIGAVCNGAVFPIFAVIFAEFVGVYFYTDTDKLRDESAFWAGIFVALAVGVFLAMSTQMLFFEWAGQTLVRNLREDTFDSMLYQEMAFFDDPENSTGSLSQILSSDVMLVKGWVSDNTGIMISNLFGLIFAMIIAFTASPELAGVVLAGALVMAPASYLEMKSMKGTSETTAAAAETPGYVMNETITGIDIVSAFCLQKEMQRKYVAVLDVGYRVGRRNAFIFGFFFGFSQFAQFGVQALAYWYGSKLMEEGKIDSVTNMMRAIFALIFAAMGFGQSAVFGTDSAKAKEAARKVYYVLERKPKIDVRSGEGTRKDVQGNIKVNEINFRYPQRADIPVYKNLTFDIKDGETVALVGPSGCGKSTVVQLLERFYDVMVSDKGRDGGIIVDKVDVRDYNLEHLRSQIGLVSQEPILFNTSVAENIMYGRQSATLDDVVAAAKMANAHDFIMGFPDGYETIVGKGGGQLSGGQKQRISIARAMIRDPKILLLDEATSALDAESEKVVQSALDNLLVQKKRTTIIIAHRLSTVRNADKIVVLTNEDKQGSVVVEVGTHSSLLQIDDGVYSNLVRIAAAAGDS